MINSLGTFWSLSSHSCQKGFYAFRFEFFHFGYIFLLTMGLKDMKTLLIFIIITVYWRYSDWILLFIIIIRGIDSTLFQHLKIKTSYFFSSKKMNENHVVLKVFLPLYIHIYIYIHHFFSFQTSLSGKIVSLTINK